ncbi:MAG: hypothetical protein A2X35_01585 [Elusimicrobia bacterium GWA2_61_42]|nr:MAG: hypothetical protein A2X35_01585 [Elusimicrobia bacterium GWA2_61_42]OGR76839.1 MAG: hypothetical protein A2X38_11760 [Elusimicrobia bacterium GWC2_61_25]
MNERTPALREEDGYAAAARRGALWTLPLWLPGLSFAVYAALPLAVGSVLDPLVTRVGNIFLNNAYEGSRGSNNFVGLVMLLPLISFPLGFPAAFFLARKPAGALDGLLKGVCSSFAAVVSTLLCVLLMWLDGTSEKWQLVCGMYLAGAAGFLAASGAGGLARCAYERRKRRG